jgi:hypothetical protein
MINLIAKILVMVHTVLCVSGMAWAIMLVVQGRDFGKIEPYKEDDTNPKLAVVYASEYDKSLAAANEAARTRNLTYTYVKPAIDSIRTTEKFFPENHLYYLAQRKRLVEMRSEAEKKNGKPFSVHRFKNGGFDLDVPDLGKPVMEGKEIDMIKKPHKEYDVDYKNVVEDIATVEAEINKIEKDIALVITEIIGADEGGKYGLYQLIDKEFKYQGQVKIEIDEIKPYWSKAVEQSRLFQFRRVDLEATLEKLKGPPPAKLEKKKL